MSLSGLSAIFVGSKTESCMRPQSDSAARCAACAIDWREMCTTDSRKQVASHGNYRSRRDQRPFGGVGGAKSEKPGRRGKSSSVSVSDLTLLASGLEETKTSGSLTGNRRLDRLLDRRLCKFRQILCSIKRLGRRSYCKNSRWRGRGGVCGGERSRHWRGS